MAEVEEQTEKLCLSDYAKKHVRYGSMAKEIGIKNEKCIKHAVQPGDTLQGLALRYGVTMEQIKRANKIWTTDSLFLRSTLNIPADCEALTVSSISSAPQSPETSPIKHSQNGESYTEYQNVDLSDQFNDTINIRPNGAANIDSEESAADFLIRIDSHIAQTKDKVLKLQNKVIYSEDDLHNSRDGFPSHMSYQYQKNTLTGSSSLSNLNSDPTITPQPVVMTKGRKVKHSLKKIERQQDEIFEL